MGVSHVLCVPVTLHIRNLNPELFPRTFITSPNNLVYPDGSRVYKCGHWVQHGNSGHVNAVIVSAREGGCL